jgi:hypothetical protein
VSSTQTKTLLGVVVDWSCSQNPLESSSCCLDLKRWTRLGSKQT